MIVPGGTQIVRPINVRDPYVVCGVGQYNGSFDVGYICSNNHGLINKWSKKKPIKYDTVAALTDNQFKGTDSDNGAGIFYGLKAAQAQGDIAGLHNADYLYYPPEGGMNAPYRLTDWEGYDHKAKPNLNCFITPDEVYYNIPGSLYTAIQFDYNGTNTTGVNINDFLPTTETKTIADYYPCVLVDGYVRALYNMSLSGGGNYIYTPLRYNNTWYSNFGTICDLSALQTNTTRTVTFFLIENIEGGSLAYSLKNWVTATLLAGSERGYTIPDGIGLSIPFSYYTATVEINNINAMQTGSYIGVSWQYPNGNPDVGTKFNVNIVAYDATNGMMYGAGNADTTYTGAVQILTFSLASLGLASLPGTTSIRFVVTITQYKPDGTLYPEYYRSTITTPVTP